VLLELLYRMLLLIIFLALSYSPRHRTVVVERLRVTLESHVNSVRQLSMMPSIAAPFTKSHLPADARILMVGGKGVGKSSLARALKRLARQVGVGELSIAEAHGPRLPDISKLGKHLELVLIVWEATQDTPLPSYVARYTQQLKLQMSRRGDGNGRTDKHLGVGRRLSGDATDMARDWAAHDMLEVENRKMDELDAATTCAAVVDASTSTDQCVDVPLPAAAPSALGGASSVPRVLVLCNKCDVMPCPMPQIRGLTPEQAFIAVSAERGTNVMHLWSMVLPLLRRQQS